jgi:hypothetical protein
MIPRKACIFLAMLTGIAALFYTDGFATGGGDASPPAPGPAWADASQNGQMSNKSLERAENYLKNKYGKYAGKVKKAPQRKVTSNKR